MPKDKVTCAKHVLRIYVYTTYIHYIQCTAALLCINGNFAVVAYNSSLHAYQAIVYSVHVCTHACVCVVRTYVDVCTVYCVIPILSYLHLVAHWYLGCVMFNGNSRDVQIRTVVAQLGS